MAGERCDRTWWFTLWVSSSGKKTHDSLVDSVYTWAMSVFNTLRINIWGHFFTKKSQNSLVNVKVTYVDENIWHYSSAEIFIKQHVKQVSYLLDKAFKHFAINFICFREVLDWLFVCAQWCICDTLWCIFDISWFYVCVWATSVVCRAVLPSTASPGGGWGSGL